MSSALSVDLRDCVAGVVEAAVSRHQGAERFGVSHASGSLWVGQFASEGHVASKPMGGEQRSRWIKTHADISLSLDEQRHDILLLN